MKIHVVIDYPNIDPDSEEADNIIQCLEMDLEDFGEEYGHNWYIDDTTED
jgi:hypothetical protein